MWHCFTKNEKYEPRIIIRFLIKDGKNNKKIREPFHIVYDEH